MYKVSKDDLDKAMDIIKEELSANPSTELTDVIESFAKSVLEICYSIGGAYEDYTIREIVKVKVEKVG